MMTYSITYFPEEVIEHIFSFLESHRDRNLVSEVCKSWYRIESLSRRSVFVSNCYVLKPERVVGRFPKIRSLRVKGKPHFADFNMVPHGWGGFVALWIEAVVKGSPGLEELRLKRMVVTDEDLELLAKSFPNLKALVLDSCEGFSTDGLAAISTNCRFLRVLDLQENEVEDRGSQWLSCFPDSCTSLETLNFACLKGEVNPGALEKLVARSPNLKTLRLSRGVMAKTLMNILVNAPQLVDLGTGSFTLDPTLQSFYGLLHAFIKCKSLRSLSGFWDATQLSLMATNPVFSELTDLNLSYAPEIPTTELLDLIYLCNKLQRLWVLDSIGDRGLAAVADTCKDLRELRVFPDINGEGIASVTEKGLVAISSGCPKLTTLLYFCHQMTNDALITVAKNCQNFTCFRLCIIEPRKPDSLTHQPLDEGFGAIVKSSKDLTRLSLSGLLTNKVFSYIGKYAEKLEMLSVAFAGDSSRGMVNVLNGCKNLRKLEIRDSPFGDSAILENVGKFETMRSLWMSSCDVTFGGCKSLAAKMPMLNVEVINESSDGDEVHEIPSDLHSVEKLYVYRTLAGPRDDAPNFVWTL